MTKLSTKAGTTIITPLSIKETYKLISFVLTKLGCGFAVSITGDPENPDAVELQSGYRFVYLDKDGETK